MWQLKYVFVTHVYENDEHLPVSGCAHQKHGYHHMEPSTYRRQTEQEVQPFLVFSKLSERFQNFVKLHIAIMLAFAISLLAISLQSENTWSNFVRKLIVLEFLNPSCPNSLQIINLLFCMWSYLVHTSRSHCTSYWSISRDWCTSLCTKHFGMTDGCLFTVNLTMTLNRPRPFFVSTAPFVYTVTRLASRFRYVW